MVQKTDGGKPLSHCRPKVQLHAAGGVVAKTSMDMVIDHGLRIYKTFDVCVAFAPRHCGVPICTPRYSGLNMNVRRMDDDLFIVRSLKLAFAARKP